MGNLDLYNRVRVVPEEAKKPIKGGRLNGMTDINPMWRIKVLTSEYGPCGIGWFYKPVKKWTEQAGGETVAFVDIELFIKVDGEWSQPICGTGGSKLSQNERNGLFVSDECYKMATTDAISVACKQLGIGADVYFWADRTKYDSPFERVERVRNELKKRRCSEANFMQVYRLDNIEQVTDSQIKDFIARMEAAKHDSVDQK
ncbi:hypothetical protein [Ruminococcus phage phiRgIBDN1]|uniref:Uncharacterized protein n=1 Tax=Ruminococcus phage phiRgIBDN1 TaxID=2772520 RepID=A0AAE7MUJ1_9CAUD|nr:hypothetical protein [Ruminococcus phage phiRgIBDN1]DAN10885.1 MAG TPA: DNA repair protein-like protein [Caudoviricetes sp.]